mgnify:CR=1 FL=1
MKSGLLRKSRLVHQVVRWVVRSKALVTAGFGVSGSAVGHLVRKTGQVVVRWFGSFRPNQRTSLEIRHFLVVGVVQPNQRQFRRPFDYLIGKISHQPKTGALVPPLPLRWLLALDLVECSHRKTVVKMLSFSVPPGYRRSAPPPNKKTGFIRGPGGIFISAIPIWLWDRDCLVRV